MTRGTIGTPTSPGAVSASIDGFTDAVAAGTVSVGSTVSVSTLNTALSAFSSAGGGVYWLGRSDLILQGTLEVPANVTLRGAGRGVCSITFTGSPTLGSAAVALTGAKAALEGVQVNITAGDYRRGVNFRADDCRCVDNGVNVTSTDLAGNFTAIYALHTSDLSGGVVEGNDVTGSSTSFNTYQFDGILANNHYGVRVRDNYVHDVTGTAITKLRWGIYCSGDSDGCLVEGNRVWNMGTSGIQVNNDSPSVGGDVYGRRIIGNSVYNCDHIGIGVDSGTVTVTGNDVRQCELNLYLGATSSECVVTGNTFRETEDGSGGSAIDADLPMAAVDGSYHSITGNSFGARGSSLIGLVIDGDNNTVSGNSFGADSPREAIRTRSGAANNRVHGNTIGPSTDTTSNRRIYLLGTNNIASDNSIEVPNSGVGIRLGGTENHAFHNVLNGAATATTGVWLNGTNNYALYNVTRGSFTNETDTTGATTPTSATHITY